MLLLNTQKATSREDLDWHLEAYLTRWRIEDTIRFCKQSYQLEDIRLLTYQRLQNMMALLLLAMSFTMTHLASNLKLDILVEHAIDSAKRFFGKPDFHYYAIADGLREILSRLTTSPFPRQSKDPPPEANLLALQFT